MTAPPADPAALTDQELLALSQLWWASAQWTGLDKRAAFRAGYRACLDAQRMARDRARARERAGGE